MRFSNTLILSDRKDALGTVGEVPPRQGRLGLVGSRVGALRLSRLIEHLVPLKHAACGLFDQVLLHALKELLGLWSPQYFGERIPMQTHLPGNLPELHAPETQVQDLK